MTFLFSKSIRKIILSIIIIWGTYSFWLINQGAFDRVWITVFGTLALIFALFEISPFFLLMYSSFSISYALYGFLFQYGLPIWLIMIIIFIVFSYIFVYTEQKIGILGNQRLIYLLLFSMIILEVFLTLNYFLISPISKSLIIATVSYVFIGFCYTVLAKHTDNKITTYILIASGVVATILLTSIWGQ